MKSSIGYIYVVAVGAIVTSILAVSMILASSPIVPDEVSPHTPPASQISTSDVMLPVEKESKSPRPNVAVPENALATPEGGYVTPLHTVDEDGNALSIEYLTDVKTGTGGEIVPACRGPDEGLYQEGATWTISSTNQKIGYQVNWKMPSNIATLQGNSIGFFYNPVNFYYPISAPEYDFFQVDYGIGNNVDPREGWIMTYSNVVGGERQYPFTQLTGVSETEGATYTVAAMLQPYPYSNPSSYVVQITQGTSSWLRGEPLGYTPALGQVFDFTSFQDQWLLSDGSTTLSRDTLTSPKVIKAVQGT
ncbi:MAG: hypothetical protein MN733_27115 [Nitrososphaera sp.]|nr:hypothetical protein [Nitrososphaera sp.]